MRRTTILLLCFLSLLPAGAFAQIGGDNTYEFLNLSSAARIAAMGGKLVPVADNDINTVFTNPALLSDSMSQQLTFSGVNYFAGIKYGYAAYAHHYEGIGNFSAAMHYVDYGTFDETDETGLVLGEFGASEYSLNLTYSRPLLDSSLSVGGTLKSIYSSLEDYTSFGMAMDLGGHYLLKNNVTNLSLVLKNIGSQITYYRPDNKEPLPFEIQFGISHRLPKAPFRFSLVLHHLEKFDLTYEDPSKKDELDPITGEPIQEDITFSDKLMRHVIFGTELLISKNFHIRASYNFQRRKELAVDTKMATVGLSWGFSFRISRFNLSYSRATYHLAGGSNHFTVTTNLGELFSKRKPVVKD
jgi:hypothetical protein